MARPLEAAPDLGNHHLQGPYRSRLVFRYRLVSHLPGCQGDFSQERFAGRVGSLSRCGLGQFFRRWCFWVPDSARLVARCGPKSAGCVWRGRGIASHPDNFHRESVPDRAALRARYVLLRLLFDDCQRAADRSLQK